MHRPDPPRPLIRPGRGVTQPSDDRAAQEKSRLRPFCRQALTSFAGPDRTAAEIALLERLYALPTFCASSLICAYIPLPGEIDLRPLWQTACDRGQRVAFPCLIEGERTMTFRMPPACDPACLVPGPHRTRQPGTGCPQLSPEDFAGALILVPGLCFDRLGFRLGYGGGYYDRFLAELYRRQIPVSTAGLTFEALCREQLPRESHDIPVDYVLTEGRIIATHVTHTSFIP